MKILFITAHPYLPQMRGGLQASTNQLCKNFLEQGHKVSVLCALMPDGLFGWISRIKMQINKRIFGFKIAKDRGSGYLVWRTWFPWEAVGHVVKIEQPDLIIVLARLPVRMALAAQKTNVPVLLKLQDVEFQHHGGSFKDLGQIPCIANSHFTAKRYRDTYGVNPTVIYPFISPENYRTQTTRENVTFINPHPSKGLAIALQIAHACPEIPFSFVESWPLTPGERHKLKQDLSHLPNVTFFSPQKDMRHIYKKCKILLVPSIWEEAYGRVATEAQISGIPVVGSSRGGLPEAIGSGGIIIDPDAPIEEWIGAIKKLWSDENYYAMLSQAARVYCNRPEVSMPHRLELWEQAIQKAFSHINPTHG